MARTPWNFSSYNFNINPEEDSGWVGENVEAENSPVGSSRSTIHWVARKTERRQTGGWIWGPGGATQLSNMKNWERNRTVSYLTDHTGDSRKARLRKFEAKPVQDIPEWKQGRQTWRWSGEWIEEV